MVPRHGGETSGSEKTQRYGGGTIAWGSGRTLRPEGGRGSNLRNERVDSTNTIVACRTTTGPGPVVIAKKEEAPGTAER